MFGGKQQPASVQIFLGSPLSEEQLARFEALEKRLMAAIDELVREIGEMKTVHDGVLAFVANQAAELNSVKADLAAARAALEAAGADTAALAALEARVGDAATALDVEANRIDGAIRGGTVADPAAPPADPGVPEAPNPEPVVEPAPEQPA